MNRLTANNENVLSKLARNKRRLNWPLLALLASGVAFWAAVVWAIV